MSILKIKQNGEWTPVGEYPLADVAFSGSYADLKDAPEIPVVDTELDETSSNAISNSVVATKFNEDIGDINSALEEIITLQEELLIPDGNEVAY